MSEEKDPNQRYELEEKVTIKTKDGATTKGTVSAVRYNVENGKRVNYAYIVDTKEGSIVIKDVDIE
jgi:hypothetical protein